MHQPDQHLSTQSVAENAKPLTSAVSIRNVNSWYGSNQVLTDVSIEIPVGTVTAFIGPSGCGKSTMLRSLNRLNDRIPGFRLQGKISVNDLDPYDRGTDLLKLRREIGIVFQKPNPFPKTIFENVALGVRAHYGLRGSELEDRVEDALRNAALWDEVCDKMKRQSGLALSGGQQQRLCIARTLAIEPRIILMDEPCSALDPISTKSIEDLIQRLAGKHTLIVVTHNLQQAFRISQHTAFFMYGAVEEFGETAQVFDAPKRASTRDYVAGAFG